MRTRTLKSVLAGGACALALATAAHAENREFSVPAGELSQALDLYIRQSGEQLIYRVADVRGMTTSGVTGELSSEAALSRLLEGTALTIKRDPSGLIAVASAESLAPQSGSAAGDGADGTVEALIVTAQKREEDIQDVPIAISAFTQEDLTRSQVAGGPDLMTQVPNMTFTKTNFTSYSIQIRGIGTQAISATTDAAVAVAFNNASMIRNRFFEQEFYDLSRVEVLRGPQGTLYGRNATAGVVNIISAKPSFGFEAKVSGDVANYSSSRLEGMVNVPLVEDAVALRVAGAWTKRDGFVTNELNGEQIDGRDLWSTRLSLRIAPSDNFEANLIWEHFEEDDDRLRSGKQLCKKHIPQPINGIPVPEDHGWAGSKASTLSQGCTPVSMYSDEAFQTPYGYALPYYGPLAQIGLPIRWEMDPYVSNFQSRDLRVIESTREAEYRAQSDLAQLQMSLDLPGALSLTSETTYSADSLFSTQDFNRFNTRPGAFVYSPDGQGTRPGIIDEKGVFCDPQIGCSDRLVLVDLSTAESRQFGQEIRISSDNEDQFNFSVGLNLLRYDTEDKYYVFANSLGLWAADGWAWENTGPVYVPGVSDNSECIQDVFPDDPRANAVLTGCIYMDPNPIGNLNDRGRNYFLSKNPYRLISYAAFGEAYYEITPGLKITAGLRWTVDKKHAPLIPSWLIVAGSSAPYPTLEVIEQEWREPTGRLAVDWKPDLTFTDETLVYGSYAHGYKAGGANPPPAVIANYGSFTGITLSESLVQPKRFDAEYVDAFEVGSKNTILDGRATLNLAAFYYDYEGYQISQIVNRSAVNLNFDAEVWGLEIEADWRPLENLRFGFKGGYQGTRVADGERAIDLMDRTAGDPNYVVHRPFPTVPSNCILPTWFVAYDGILRTPNGSNGNPGACVLAFIANLDPVTLRPYEPNPTVVAGGTEQLVLEPTDNPNMWYQYPGFDPSAVPNNGEGIFKDLSGNKLPNAPSFTSTITVDYTLPLPNDWLMTVHSDLYYQSEAWTRIFNMEGYDKLKAYTNVNLAAIFTNEGAGWNVMAYVKNVFDRDSITGAFLNSDDTGLTTNVFLTEPRLYGLRVTKSWSGSANLGSHLTAPGGEPRFSVEVGGSILRHDAPAERLAPAFLADFSSGINPVGAQGQDLDWGDGREVKLTYSAVNANWDVSLGLRFGEANRTAATLKQELGDRGCIFAQAYCTQSTPYREAVNYGWSEAVVREEHIVADFIVGRDVGLGALGIQSNVSFGARYAQLKSSRVASMLGIPDWDLPDDAVLFKYAQHHEHAASITAESEFEGLGPMITWDAYRPLNNAERGSMTLDWSVGGGVLFGRQQGSVTSETESAYFDAPYFNRTTPAAPPVTTLMQRRISESATAPHLNVSLGLSYRIGGFKVSAGYRAERYFDVIDGGIAAPANEDRTIDGPYFKLTVGFGG